MWRAWQNRYLGPVALISLCLVGLCAFTAISLFQQQTTLSSAIREDVASHLAAAELEECLFDLITLLQHRVESVASLHERVRVHLHHVQQYANQPEEADLFNRMDSAFATYQREWKKLPRQNDARHEEAVKKAVRSLETELLRPCQQFEQYNKERIGDSLERHDRVLSRLAWGLAGVGALGAIAGMVLGYGVARSVSQSIHRLRVQIRDAEGKIDRPAEIVLTDTGDFAGLHDQVERLSHRIEGVVQQLHERETEVLRAEQLAAVGQLAAGVAHEIRNPLTSIKLLVQSGLEDSAPASLTSEDLQVMEREILRMEQSLRTFLDFARPAKPERRRLLLEPMVTDVLGLIRGRAVKQQVRLTTSLDENLPALQADGAQLHQVLVNLALNALDAMPSGGELTIRVERMPLDRLQIQVLDSGAGIATELLPRLFRPFVSSKDTGCGLGLVISRRIVEAHGGSLTAANRTEGGAVFTLVLPVETSQDREVSLA